ncbi:MAG: N-acetylmuramate alpha-1-phosphate uridylyltransferase MurU [Porticoccaceae bacterium]
MKAMILAAGYGKRLRPLTQQTPKPMLEVAGKPLLQHHIERLAASGFTDLVINTSWLGEQIERFFGDGSQFGVQISWSREAQPLETGGGIVKALPLLGEQPFLLLNGDIWTDYPLRSISENNIPDNGLAWLLMVANPEHNPTGDFGLVNGLVSDNVEPTFTFSGLSVIHPKLLGDYTETHEDCQSFPLRAALWPAIERGRVGAALYNGHWYDVGTLERYRQLNHLLAKT